VCHSFVRSFDLSIGEASHVQELLRLAVKSDMTSESLKVLISLLPIAEKALEHCLVNLLKEATDKTRYLLHILPDHCVITCLIPSHPITVTHKLGK
jgi:hypothetical protein